MIGLLLALAAQDLVPVEDLGLRLRRGFRAALVADAALANDLYSMTLDAEGRVVVSSQGWIKRLEDADGDGRLDRAILLAECRSGAMGMAFDGPDLLVSEAGGLKRYPGAKGPPELLSPFAFGEHGHHAIRKGPDGYWYLIGGNDARVDARHATDPASPVRAPQTGALVRFSPDFSGSRVLAHGMRNAYDFDWNSAGDVFTYDSDCERDFLLPWYLPTRVYHLQTGMHHGWRLTGWTHGFPRRDTWWDVVPMLHPVGRGSPTGVTVYRHTLFPERYRDGVFVLDWTFGRVWFLELTRQGASYLAKAEVFLEPSGSDGFAPSDVVVAPDGALLVCIGGRRTRGGVYRITPEQASPAPRLEGIDAVLRAPQPMDAWSRNRWVPAARALGKAAFEARVADPRAVEILTELFGGLSPEAAAKAAPARAAWSLGIHPAAPEVLVALSRHADPAVRLAALEAGAPLESARLEDSDPRVRRSAAWRASRLGEAEWKALDGSLGLGLARLWREGPSDAVVAAALARLPEPDAVRLLVAGLGDCAIERKGPEIHAMYALPNPVPAELRARILSKLRPALPDPEAARLAAMLEDEDPASLDRVAATLTERSSPTADVHALSVLSRLAAPWTDTVRTRIAGALLGLSAKLAGQEQRNLNTWSARLREYVEVFSARDAGFAGAVLVDPRLVLPDHVAVASSLPGEARIAAARRFLEAARKDPKFPWSDPLLRLFALLPREEVIADLRAQWSNYGLRDALLFTFAASPEPQDRDKFLASVDAPNAQVAAAALGALEKLPKDGSKETLLPLLRLQRRLAADPKEAAKLKRVKDLLARESGKAELDPKDFPELVEGAIDVAARLKDVPWDQGDAARGAEVFRARGCQTCHAVQGALGPNLAGAAGRMSREDLFTAIGDPSRDVAPPYRTTAYLMKDGQSHAGVVMFGSADGVIVQTGATTTVRLATGDIAATRPGTLSLMPNGLLDGLKPGDLSDLYAYLRTLGR
jgi:putative membrane-bound dehydrogenase-like protein